MNLELDIENEKLRDMFLDYFYVIQLCEIHFKIHCHLFCKKN